MAAEKQGDSRTLGHVIRARRIELGLTQEELAERVGESVRQSDISRMERDYVMLPRRERLEALAAALEVTPGFLLMQSGWITPEQGSRQDLPGEHDPSAPTPLPTPGSGTAEGADEPSGMSTRLEPGQFPVASTHLTHAIDHARRVSRETEEVLRKTSSTVDAYGRSRRSKR